MSSWLPGRNSRTFNQSARYGAIILESVGGQHIDIESTSKNMGVRAYPISALFLLPINVIDHFLHDMAAGSWGSPCSRRSSPSQTWRDAAAKSKIDDFPPPFPRSGSPKLRNGVSSLCRGMRGVQSIYTMSAWNRVSCYSN